MRIRRGILLAAEKLLNGNVVMPQRKRIPVLVAERRSEVNLVIRRQRNQRMADTGLGKGHLQHGPLPELGRYNGYELAERLFLEELECARLACFVRHWWQCSSEALGER